MNLTEIIELVDGKLLNPEVGLNIKIRGGCGADLMFEEGIDTLTPQMVS